MRHAKSRHSNFCAHVYNPGEYLAIFIMLLVFIIGASTWLVIDVLKPIREDDGEKFTLTFSFWEIQEDFLVLTSAQMQEPFIVNGYEDYLHNFDQLIQNCDSKTTFTVCAKRYEPDDADPFFRVYALSAGEEIYRTFEDSAAYQRTDLAIIVVLLGSILIFVLAFSGFIYAVGSNPQKYPRWVVYLCFKKDAIRI